MSSNMLSSWIEGHKLQAPTMQDAPAFFRNIEEKLDVRRANHSFWSDTWKDRDALDFSSNDTLSLDFASGGARSLPDGRYIYLEKVEQEIAGFHGAECGLILGSGFEANVAIYTSIPQAGDIILYDELVHASVHDGMQKGRADKISFHHNNVESFREALLSALGQPLIQEKERSVFVAVESVYSMEGDICPLKELFEAAKDVLDNVYFFVDEAHGTGVIGPNGSGLVNALGLEKEVAVRLHTFSKVLGANGAIVLGKKTIRDALITLARPVFFSTAPSFPFVALIRSGYKLLISGETKTRQDHVQHLVKMFFKKITSNPAYQKAVEMGILSVPLTEGWNE
ncbi:PLP-dependent transferase [Aspergillus piperis CBS 112811]|uniref:PLP-dependent transferase n=1 Tax=Aspergillus piperis CBS 112811 TaxID=1448313 RepID=A0A8G1R0U9_9EURO|nr:PLP-dependent transferase [Aspergillus piperis CBS 112811]RAH57478.1 PLP-dependent transferase [Aspergillus piperis CBS 112811]